MTEGECPLTLPSPAMGERGKTTKDEDPGFLLFAGMTEGGAGMTEGGAGMTEGGAGMTEGGAGMTEGEQE